MFEIADEIRKLGRLGASFGLAMFLVMPLTAAGCGSGGGSPAATPASANLDGGAPSPAPTAAPAPTATPQVTPTAISLPTATTGPQATSTSGFQAQVSQQEAESVVRSWFQALAAQDYQKAESLTVGQAQNQTQQLVTTIQQQEKQNNVSLQFNIQKLDLSQASNVSVPRGGQAVLADFAAEIVALKGPLHIPARNVSGNATFTVTPTRNGPKISDIENIQGLSVQ